MQAIRDRLIELRKKQVELARVLGMSESVLSKLMTGRRTIRASELPVAAAFLEWPVETLIDALKLNGAKIAGGPAARPNDNSEESFDQQFRQRLVELREGLGWTQERMANALGTPVSTYMAYETHAVAPMYLLPRLALISGRTLSWLLTGYG